MEEFQIVSPLIREGKVGSRRLTSEVDSFL